MHTLRLAGLLSVLCSSAQPCMWAGAPAGRATVLLLPGEPDSTSEMTTLGAAAAAGLKAATSASAAASRTMAGCLGLSMTGGDAAMLLPRSLHSDAVCFS